jgi:hypothetical protein
MRVCSDVMGKSEETGTTLRIASQRLAGLSCTFLDVSPGVCMQLWLCVYARVCVHVCVCGSGCAHKMTCKLRACLAHCS